MAVPTPIDCLLAILGGQIPSVLPNGIARIERRQIGLLRVSTGNIVACDPFLLTEPMAYTVTTPTGRFPVELFIAHFDGGDQRIAAARLGFASGVSDAWELALLPHQDVSQLEPDQFFGYAVDSGAGSFMDLDAARELDQRMTKDEEYFQEIIRQMEINYVHTREWTLFQLHESDDLN